MNITKDDVGRRVWSFEFGWCTLIEVSDQEYGAYIALDFRQGKEIYTKTGQYFLGQKQTLFWDEIKFEIPPKPKRKVKKVIEMWVNIYPSGSSFTYSSERLANVGITEKTDRIACVKLTGEYEVDEE